MAKVISPSPVFFSSPFSSISTFDFSASLSVTGPRIVCSFCFICSKNSEVLKHLSEMASSLGQSRVINPGPEDPSLLRFQSIHVSEHVWDGHDHPTLRLAEFIGVANLSQFPLDVGLITALVERWRPETHTFHMPPRECTITLQDVAILLGLRIDGRPVIAPTGGDWAQIVEDSLGIRPGPEHFVGSFLKISWLDIHFTHISMHNHSPMQITRFARAYILRLIGGFILADHSSSRVFVRYLPLLEDFELTGQYSWGLAVLGYLY
ncbi:protein MAIN-LIKE 2-like [Abrus precatorius]|uniref:Protein MAIN-LIKE 2-like n=1 Tax=Abrus precatorius TaxID=3816 RepID=A0A8B8MJY5_ABRPR|nr:protein MAIN-LIKE 2-like [Abrus precatorius]